MDARTVHIKSFGCQMNKLDTALVRCALLDAGFTLTESIDDADVVLLNTCSVRQHAEQRVLSHLGNLSHIKEIRPDMVVCVIGCMAQRLGDKLLEHKVVNIVCGPALRPSIWGLKALLCNGSNAPAQRSFATSLHRQLAVLFLQVRSRETLRCIKSLAIHTRAPASLRRRCVLSIVWGFVGCWRIFRRFPARLMANTAGDG